MKTREEIRARDEREAKKDISERLRLSNKDLWENLSLEMKNAVIDMNYHMWDLDKVGIRQVLDANRQIRMNLTILILGLLLGVFGNIVAGIAIKYMPSNPWSDAIFLIAAVFGVWYMFTSINKLSAERLADDNVLEHLVELVNSENSENTQNNS